jgi:uncharacterized protein
MFFKMTTGQTNELRDLCKKYEVLELKLFGSAAREDFNPESSDLDFLVTFAEPPVGMRLGTQFFGFLEELKTLFGKEIDLLEESAIENSRLKASAQASAVTLYAA